MLAAGCLSGHNELRIVSSDERGAVPSYVNRYVRKNQSERRQEIIDATLELLGEYGLEGTTVSRIAAAVGLTPGALYRHFESRAALIAEANRVASEQVLGWIETSDEPNILRRLEELGNTHAAWAKDNFNTVVRSFFSELGSAQQPDLADHLNLATIKPYWALVDLADQGKRQGTIRPDVRSEDVAWAVLMCTWAEDIARLVGSEQSVEDGTFVRNLKRMLDAFRPEQPAKDEG
jgi:AcrR family transcriptional regulator